jgi:transposase
MDREALRAAKAQMVAHMQAGQSWHEAATNASLQTSRASAYRLLRRVRTEGAVALDDQRHGHPTKVRQPVRDWLAAFCRAAPEATGRTVQAALLGEFGLLISVSQINRLRAALGIRRQVSGAGEKSAERLAP